MNTFYCICGLYYRAHSQSLGWGQWVRALDETVDAEPTKAQANTRDGYAGTMGLYKRLEAIEMVLVLNEKGKAALAEARADYGELLDALYNEGRGTAAGILEKADYDKAVADMNSALTVEELEAAYNTAKAALMSVAEHDLYVAKQNAINTLKAAFPADEYTVWADELKTELDLAIERINACTTTNAVANTTTTEIERIGDTVKSDEVNARELQQAKNSFESTIKGYIGLSTPIFGRNKITTADGKEDYPRYNSLILDKCFAKFNEDCLTAAKKPKEVEDYFASGAPRKVVLDELKVALKALADQYYNNGNGITIDGKTFLIPTSEYKAFLDKLDKAGKLKISDDPEVWEEKDQKELRGDKDLEPLIDSTTGFNKLLSDSQNKTIATIKASVLSEFNTFIADLSTKDFTEKIKDGKVDTTSGNPVNFGFDGVTNYISADTIANAVGKAKIAINNSADTQAELDKALKDGKDNVLAKVKEYVGLILKAHYDAPEETRLDYALSDSDYRSLVTELNEITELDDVFTFFKEKAIKAMVKQQGADIAEDVTVETKSAQLNKVEDIKEFLGTGDATVKSVADLQKDDVNIAGPRYDADGEVAHYDLTSGTLHYVTKFDAYATGDPTKQAPDQDYVKGNFLVLHFENSSASTITSAIIKDSKADKNDDGFTNGQKNVTTSAIDNSLSIIAKMTPERKFDIEITYADELGNTTKAIYHIDGSKLTCEA